MKKLKKSSGNNKYLYSNKKDTCFVSCIANLLHKHPDSLPDFVGKYNNNYLKECRKYLKNKFIDMVVVDNIDGLSLFMPVGFHIRLGKCIYGGTHACIYMQNICVYEPLEIEGGGLQEGSTYKYIFLFDNTGNQLEGY